MDPALLKSHEAFKRRATTSSGTDAKSARLSDKVTSDAVAKAKSRRDNKTFKIKEAEKLRRLKEKQKQALLEEENRAVFAYKNIKAAPTNNLSVLAKVVNFMKERHLAGQTWSLTFDEVLPELQIYDLSRSVREWVTQRLPRNPVLEFDDKGVKFHYRPPFPIKNRSTMLGLLKRHNVDNKGGILASEVADCVGNSEKLIESLGELCIKVATNAGKKKDFVLFFNDQETDVTIDDEFKEDWRKVTVEHMEERKIDEYLAKHGINTMMDLGPKRAMHTLKRRTRKTRPQQVQNEHMAGTLQDYSIG